MPRSYYTPERGPNASIGHWESRIEGGKVVDVWFPHCAFHQYQELPCDLCPKPLTDGSEGED